MECLVFIFLIIIIAIASQYLEEDSRESMRSRRWIFVKESDQPAVEYDDLKMEKNYRGHLVLVDTIYESVGDGKKVFTRIALSRHDPLIPDIAPGDHRAAVENMVDHLAIIQFPHLPLEQSSIPMAKIVFNVQSQTLLYQQPNVMGRRQYVESLIDPLCEILEIYLNIVALGGRAMPALGAIATDRGLALPQANPSLLQQIITDLMQGVARDTTHRLGYRASYLLCPHCLTRFRAHTLKLSWLNAMTYYGCRVCHQSNEFLQGRVLAVLNQQMQADHSQDKDIVRLNWLTYRRPFDFDGIYIGQATDEDIERFTVQAGNDTDPWRRPRYSKIPCTLSPEAQLSANSMRILERTFGEMMVG